MGALLERLKSGKVLVSDGAWGTELQAAGLPPGEAPEKWNRERPDAVRDVAARYIAAGADIVLTNTFGGNALKLAKIGLEAEADELNRLGAALSAEAAAAAKAGTIVAASMGPTGEFVEPYGDYTEEQFEDVFFRQAKALKAGGAVAACVETMSAVEEACVAVRAAKKAGLDVMATLTFDPAPDGYRTMMGVAPAAAAEALAAAGADVVGANCGHGPAQMVGIVEAFRKATSLPILIHANAGVPELVDRKTVFRESPESFAEQMLKVIDAGARIVGGCCGTTPAHIHALRKRVDARK